MGVDNNNEHYDNLVECERCGREVDPGDLNHDQLCEDCIDDAYPPDEAQDDLDRMSRAWSSGSGFI